MDANQVKADTRLKEMKDKIKEDMDANKKLTKKICWQGWKPK
jgi:hypothetical protein